MPKRGPRLREWKGRVAWTVRVAASDAPLDWKRSADFVCDGTDDHQEWLDAIALLPDEGGDVEGSMGTFNVDYIEHSRSHVRIRGQGDGTVFKLQAQTRTVAGDGGVIRVVGTEQTPIVGSGVYDLKVDGNEGNQTDDDSGDWQLEGVDFKRTVRCEAINVTVVDCWQDGIDIDGSSEMVVERARLIGNGGNGVHLGGLGGGSEGENNRNTVAFCYAEDNGSRFDRAGFDQNSVSSETTYMGNIARDNYRNWNIEGSDAVWIGNQSLGTTTEADVLTGVSDSGGGSPTASMGVVAHESDADVSRPSAGHDQYTWIGSVQPNNWADLDLWFDTSDDSWEHKPAGEIPLNIAWDAVYWADEIEGLSNSDPVSQWDDESGNGHHLAETGDSRPTYVASSATLNSQPAVAADGVDQRLITSTMETLSQPYTWVLVGWIANRTAEQKPLFANGPIAVTKRESDDASNPNTLRFFAGSGPLENTAEPPGADPFIAIFVADGSSSDVRVNGESAVGNAGTDGMSNPFEAFAEENAKFTEGEYGFIGIKDGELTSQERDDLESWAVSHYGVTLAT